MVPSVLVKSSLKTEIRDKMKNPFLVENESFTYGLVYFEKELDSGATHHTSKIKPRGLISSNVLL